MMIYKSEDALLLYNMSMYYRKMTVFPLFIGKRFQNRS